MDQLLSLLPTQAIPYVTGAIAVASLVATVLPPPPAGANQIWVGVYTVVNWVALNLGHATNATDPTLKPKV